MSSGFVHQALVYGSDDEFLAGTVSFVDDGLNADDEVVVVTSPTNIELLKGTVGEASRLEYIDATTWYRTPGATHAAYYRRAQAYDGPGQIRVIGEPVWTGRSDLEVQEWKRYESVINTSFASTSSWILCPYDSRVLPEHIVTDAARTHPEVVRAEDTWKSLTYADPAVFGATCDARELPGTAGTVESLAFEREQVGGRGGLRDFVRRSALTRGLDDDRVQSLVLAVHEVVMNAVQHGGGQGRVDVWSDGRDLICDVFDSSGSLGVRFAGYLPPGSGAADGRGLWIARQLCDLVEFRSGGADTTVRLRMRL